MGNRRPRLMKAYALLYFIFNQFDMPISFIQQQALEQFFQSSQFFKCGAVITDLDGTAIHEYKGKYSIPNEIELGLKKIYDLGRPIVLNTLRFPLSVMRTFGKEWYRISNRPIPTVLMNGSQLGYIVEEENEKIGYKEIAAFPLIEKEIDDVISIVKDLLHKNVNDIIVFFYPRQWQKGEIIWTPVEEKKQSVAAKYASASEVISGSLQDLEKNLKQQEICMIFLLINVPQDQLMAYQHTKHSNFFTHKGVDKEYGALRLAEYLKFDMGHSIGAGDSEMDTFLKSVGMAILVGNPSLTYKGLYSSTYATGSGELGDIFFTLASLQEKLAV